MPKYIISLDQGTTSSRCILFDHGGRIVSVAQKEFTQIFPNPGWVEHDPMEIWESIQCVMAQAMDKAGVTTENIAAIGITNQGRQQLSGIRRQESRFIMPLSGSAEERRLS